jgi:hypothetical protein
MRLDALRMIQDNPSVITISRKTWTIANGKRTSASSSKAAQTVRLYGKNTSELRTVDDVARWIRTREVRMLCVYNADVLPHSNTNEDTFTLNSTKYRVINVRDITWEGIIISKQCTLEELA